MNLYGIEKHGILSPKNVYRNLSAAVLTELAVKNENAQLMDNGALLITTGKYTGRSPSDRFVVYEESVKDEIDWGANNQKIDPKYFDRIYTKITAYLNNRDVYIRDAFVGADPSTRLSVRVINEYASHNLFISNMFLRPKKEDLEAFAPDFTVISAPGLMMNPETDGTKSEACIVLSFEKKMVLIAGTSYCGEMKKSLFAVMNYLLPKRGILGMHCSANMALDGSNQTALFFGLSGTGKTTLSADPNRGLIGDDEHGWSDDGVFNFEGGCYAKCIDLTEEKEPEIYRAIRAGSVVENVVVDAETHAPDYSSQALTENTRVCYPIEYIPNAVIPSVGGHPKTVVFLTADAFGVLPPVSKLTNDQAMYYFLSGYTSKLAGTERGIVDPQCTFSTCFGSPFLPLKSSVYGKLLGEKIQKHGSDVYLINTGWSGGQYGVGKRFSIKATRAIVTAALNGSLANVEYRKDEYFGLYVPTSCEGVDANLLNPVNTWQDKEAYSKYAKKLAADFKKNFEKYAGMPESVIKSGPQA